MMCAKRCCWSLFSACIGLFLSAVCAAQSTALLLQKANLVYQGAFRVPQLTCTSQSYACFSYGGTAITYNAANNSLFLVGHRFGQLSAEISIPAVVNNGNLSALATSTLLQPFSDPADGSRTLVNPSSPNAKLIGGQLVYENRLIFSVYSYYDGAGTQRTSHFARPLDLSSTGAVSGPYAVGHQYPGYVSGYMGTIPAEWQGQLGGPAITGNCCLAITSLQSNGPSAAVFDPSLLGSTNPVPDKPLVGYPHTGPLGPGWGTQNGLFNGTTQITGVVFPSATRSVLFIGRQGIGSFCYGSGTSTKALDGKPTGQGSDIWCFDPANQNKGTHAYPYVYQVWAYDANDLLAVKTGSRQPYDVKPYATWSFSLPFEDPNGNQFLGGAAYDAQNQMIYISQMSGDANANPIIHVFKIDPTVPVPQPPGGLRAQ